MALSLSLTLPEALAAEMSRLGLSFDKAMAKLELPYRFPPLHQGNAD